MLKYLIIPLAEDAESFCHYERKNSGNLIPLQTLREAIRWAMTENLNIQFVYPDSEFPAEYKEIIDTIDHADIVGCNCKDTKLLESADIVVANSWEEFGKINFTEAQSYVIRSSKDDLINHTPLLSDALSKADRIVVVLTDIADFKESDFEGYKRFLESMVPTVKAEYEKGHAVHFNLLTDRILLENMNNCNAGHESITLAPDGRFYICPAFYADGSAAVGNLSEGIAIHNAQLFRLDHAPICRNCDAYQCRRCVWLNRNTTLEVNTPSHEQCVVAHIERNVSRMLLNELRKLGTFMPEKEIVEIDYLDPINN